MTKDSELVVIMTQDRKTLTVRDAGSLLVSVCHQASKGAGWWKSEGMDLSVEIKRSSMLAGALVAQKLCLIHSEVSEAMEGHRKGLRDDKLKHRPMIEVELADAMIRICDLAGALGLDLGGAIAEKIAYNATRADHKPEARNASGGKSYASRAADAAKLRIVLRTERLWREQRDRWVARLERGGKDEEVE